jgi:hypothetical protein
LKDSMGNDLYSGLAARLDTVKNIPDSTESVGASFNNYGAITFHLQENKYAMVKEYDSTQHTLADSARDDVVTRYMIRKLVWLTHEKGHANELVVTRNFKHDIPKIMFLLLPLFALYVSFFYSRRKYSYAEHAIFSLHFHSFAFLFFMLESLVEQVLPMDKMWLILPAITLFCTFIYLSLALHKAYRESLWLSFFKAAIISLLYIITLLLGFCIVIVATFVLLK